VSACCPHCGFKLSEDEMLSWGGYTANEISRELTLDGDARMLVRLTRSWMQIATALMRRQGKIVSKEAMLNSAYGLVPECDVPEIKIIDVFVCKLRAAAPWFLIETVWGGGYRLLPAARNTVRTAAGS